MVLTFREFFGFLKLRLKVRYANKDYLNCQDLQLFLETEQGIIKASFWPFINTKSRKEPAYVYDKKLFKASNELCENIIDLYEPCPEAKDNTFMTVDGFTSYLMSSGNSVFDPAHMVKQTFIGVLLKILFITYSSSGCVSGYDPALQPLLHSHFAQHVSR
jgi:hypothetical protein